MKRFEPFGPKISFDRMFLPCHRLRAMLLLMFKFERYIRFKPPCYLLTAMSRSEIGLGCHDQLSVTTSGELQPSR